MQKHRARLCAGLLSNIGSGAVCASLIAGLAMGCSSRGSASTAAALKNAPAVEVALSFADVTVKNQGGQARFEGAQLSASPGSPLLPVQTVRVLVDPDADLHQVSAGIEGAEEKDVPGTFQVPPAMPMASNGVLRWPAGAKIVDGKDMNVYGKSELFPQSSVGRVTPGRLGRFKIIEVLVFPYRWNPVTGALRALVGGRLMVRAASGATDTDGATAAALDGRHRAEVAKLVSNFDAEIGRYEAAAPGSGLAQRSSALTTAAAGYAIVTTTSLSSAAYMGKFADAKAAQGFTVEMVTESTAYVRRSGAWACLAPSCNSGWGGGTGEAAAEGIRAWLKSNYVAQNLAYALLIGDPDPVSGDVPMKRVWTDRRMPDEGVPVSTDAYYGELSGNWDANGDGYAGELTGDVSSGDPDRYFELAVGRIPFYGDLGQLNHILAKTIAYESAAPADIAWRKSALLAMKPLDAYPAGPIQTPTYELGEWIRSAYLLPSGWSATRIYDRDFGVAPEITPCTYDTVLSAWRSTPHGLTIWTSHGSWSGSNEIITYDRVSQLDDLYPTITFAISCSTANLEVPNNLTYSLLRNGAVVAIGESRDGTYAAISPALSRTMSGDGYATNFAKHLVTRGETVGQALNSSRADGIDGWSDGVILTLLGDPSLSTESHGTGVIEMPTAPSTPAVQTGDQSVTLTWGIAPAAALYVVRRATTPGGPYTVLGTTGTTSYTDRNALSNGTPYYYVVSSRNSAGDSLPSAEVVGTPSSAIKVQYLAGDTNLTDDVIRPYLRVVNTGTVPQPISDIVVRYSFSDESSSQWTYTCESATIGCESVLTYPGTAFANGAEQYLAMLFYTSSILGPGESMEIRGTISHVASLNFNEANDYSYDASRTTFADSRRITAYVQFDLKWGDEPPIVVVDSPSYPMAIPGNGEVNLSWAAVHAAAGYNVYRSGGGATRKFLTFTTGRQILDKNLVNGATYTYDVAGVSAAGREGYGSDAVSATPSASTPSSPPPAPTGLSATVENGRATFTWDPTASATTHNLKRGTAPGGPYLNVAPNELLPYAIVELDPGTVYYFVLSAVNYAGEGPISAELAVSANGVLPAKVTGLTASATSGKVALSWNASARATGYVVKRAILGGAYQAVTTTADTSYPDTGVSNGTTYSYVVVATNFAGEGLASDAVSAKPVAPSEPCSPAQDMTNGQSGNFNTTGSVCKRTAENIAGWGCSNFEGRTVKVNGVVVTCGKVPLPAKTSSGYYYFDVSAGALPWASLYWWK